MRRILIFASLAGALAAIGLPAEPAVAADLAAFRAACRNGGPFLVGELPEGKTAQPVVDALCPCLEAGFASYSQPELDALEADLRTGNSYEAKARFGGYQQLQARATAVLNTCFASPAVVAALRMQGL